MFVLSTNRVVQVSVDDDKITVGSVRKLDHLDVPYCAQVQQISGENTEFGRISEDSVAVDPELRIRALPDRCLVDLYWSLVRLEVPQRKALSRQVVSLLSPIDHNKLIETKHTEGNLL